MLKDIESFEGTIYDGVPLVREEIETNSEPTTTVAANFTEDTIVFSPLYLAGLQVRELESIRVK